MSEMIDIVDEDDKVVGQERRDVAKKKAMIYRSSHIILLNKNGEFFVQKRAANKDLWPGMYEVGIGETVKSGESHDSAATRGLMEETGVKAKPQPLFAVKYRSAADNENVKVYICISEETPTFADGEVSEGLFVSEGELKETLKEREFTPISSVIMEKYWEQAEKG